MKGLHTIFAPRRSAAVLALLVCFAVRSLFAEEGGIEFNRDIRPLLSENCFFCHGPDARERQANLRLDTEAGLLSIRDGHATVRPGDPRSSELYRRIATSDASERMPPPDSGKELSDAQKDLLRRWIEAGAEYQKHWSFAALSRPGIPAVADGAWPQNAIDRFILARLENAGLGPSPEADRITLARRLHLDLLGLPPTPAWVNRFVEDDAPDAYERLVDTLLASPHFGERMAIYWLDLVRYADSVGYHGDQEHSATPYRDYVIEAFNENLPFDQFTAEQLAGDLLPDATQRQRVASGYNRLLQTTHEGGAQDKEYLAKYAADRVRNVSSVWMGATMGCAECHDHKYDPYTQRDFYSLVAFFADVEEQGAYNSPNRIPTLRAPEILVLSDDAQREAEQLRREVKRLEGAEASGSAGAGESLAALKKRLAAIEKDGRYCMITVPVEPRTIRILERGDWLDETGEIVEPAVPHFLPGLSATERRATRLDLARWLTARENPQTARVLANRLWYLFFGSGLSRILDDTGSQGEWPTHPALLDHLAIELVVGGWDLKETIRALVLSKTYRQSSLATPGQLKRDPKNLLFSRQMRGRLPAEVIRDTALAVSGLLTRTIGGGSARPYQPAGYYSHLNFPKRKYVADADAGQFRRGVYTHWQRQFLHPMLKAFDAPLREECTAERPVSNTPLAALTLLNDPSFVEMARHFAQRILREGGESREARVRWAWRQAVSRSPSSAEAEQLAQLYGQEAAFYREHPDLTGELLAVGISAPSADLDPVELAAWTQTARALLNLNETITRN